MPTPAPMHGPTRFEGIFRRDDDARAAYSQGAGPYRILPAAVAVPAGEDDLVRLVDFARTEGHHLIPRGAGSGIPGNNVGTGIVVDLARFTAPVTPVAEGVVRAGAALTPVAVDDAVSHEGWRFPPDPSSRRFCTLGGMIATDAAGPRSLRLGATRRWVQGLDLVTGTGERLSIDRDEPWRSGSTSAIRQFETTVLPRAQALAAEIEARYPRTTKNTAGYALNELIRTGHPLDLVIGSEGTLGFVTEVRLRLDRVPAARAGLVIGIADLDLLGDLIPVLRALRPTAIEMLDRTLLTLGRDTTDLPVDRVEAVLMLEFERDHPSAARGVVGDAVRAVDHVAVFVRTALDDESFSTLWELRHAASPALARLPTSRRSLQIVEDGCVPVAALGAYVRGVRTCARACGVEVVAFGHAGDGHLHVNALADVDAPDCEDRLRRLHATVSELLLSLGGTPSGEHGDGRLRTPLLRTMYGPDILDLFGLAKSAFDPDAILNPGVIVAEAGVDPIAYLKVGRNAVPISDDVANGLLAIERQGGWDTFKLTLADRRTPSGQRVPERT